MRGRICHRAAAVKLQASAVQLCSACDSLKKQNAHFFEMSIKSAHSRHKEGIGRHLAYFKHVLMQQRQQQRDSIGTGSEAVAAPLSSCGSMAWWVDRDAAAPPGLCMRRKTVVLYMSPRMIPLRGTVVVTV